MKSWLQRFFNPLDLRLLVWLIGLWLVIVAPTPRAFLQLDQQLFSIGASLTPERESVTGVDVLELNESQMRRLLLEPTADSHIVDLLQQLQQQQTTVGFILPALPRHEVVLAEQMMRHATADNPLYQSWQIQESLRHNFLSWLNSEKVLIGSRNITPRLNRRHEISVIDPKWKTYFAGLSESASPAYPFARLPQKTIYTNAFEQTHASINQAPENENVSASKSTSQDDLSSRDITNTKTNAQSLANGTIELTAVDIIDNDVDNKTVLLNDKATDSNALNAEHDEFETSASMSLTNESTTATDAITPNEPAPHPRSNDVSDTLRSVSNSARQVLQNLLGNAFSLQQWPPDTWPIYLEQDTNDALAHAILLEHDRTWFPSFALALIRAKQENKHLQWNEQSTLILTGQQKRYTTNADGSIFPIYQDGSALTPRLIKHDIDSLTQQKLAPSLLLIAAQNDPALLHVAGTIQSLQSHQYYISPWWFALASKMLLLIIIAYAMWLLPILSSAVALLTTAVITLLMLVIQVGAQLSQSQWLPLGVAIQYLVFAFIIMSIWRQQQKPLQQLKQHHHDVACQWSQQLSQQGQLEQAVAVLSHSQTSEKVLQLLYDIGGQHERKRRPASALDVYRLILARKRRYKDVKARMKKLQEKQHAPIEDTSISLAKTVVLSDPHSRPQFGRYDIEKELGRGAMGVVYLGFDPHIARKVAIKTLDYSQYQHEELAAVKQRFFNEAEAAGRLRHPNIVTVYDVGEDTDLAFIAMDYLAGQPLSDFVSEKTLLPPIEVYRIAAEVAEALDYAHQENVVHRDIKPGNIMYDRETRKVTVTDFGIARIVNEQRTQTGDVFGSPLYMSPEQITGKKVAEPSDIFSLGVTLFQLLTGQLPFDGDNIAKLSYQIVHEKHRNIRDMRAQLPASAQRIINKALQKNPADRYIDAGEMARALRKAMQRDFS